jgi:hypothetical protein
MAKKQITIPDYPFRLDRRSARVQPLKRSDHLEDVLLGYNALECGDEQKALRYFRRALETYKGGLRNEMSGITKDRRGGSIGPRRMRGATAEMLAYAESLPRRGGGRSRKSRWRLAAEHYNPDASDDRLAAIVRRLKRAAGE